ncbi:MAG: transposase [Cenarchaeum sp. SB0661_bin_35]|nr:transposase [Cenarchaeum sp. SB0662_bin_33]MYC79214.1 transposase [Cenarchaeum sp. SB0661_bin_35]
MVHTQQQNNFQERFNGTFRRFQSRQHISNPDSPLIMGFFVYYNFVRPHSSLHKRTPAAKAGVIIHGNDEWETIIGNASLAARTKEARP